MSTTVWTRIDDGTPFPDTWASGSTQRPYLFATAYPDGSKAAIVTDALCTSYRIDVSPIGKAWVNVVDPWDYRAAFVATDYAVGTTCTIKAA